MAVQIDSPGQVQDFLAILRKRKWQVLLPIAYTLTLGGAFAVLVPKKYRCSTQVELRELYIEGARADRALSISSIEAESAPQQLQSLTRIRKVIEKLEWPDYLRLSPQERNEFLVDRRRNLSITVPRREKNTGSTFVTISYSDVNPQRAYQFLRELRGAWIDEVVVRDREQIRSEYENLVARTQAEQQVHDELLEELTKLKAAHDLSPTQPGAGEGRTRNEDPLYARLTQNQERLAALELEMETADARVLRLEEELARTQATIPRTELVAGDSFQDQIAALRLSRMKVVKLLEDGGYRPEHSKYKALQKELVRIDRDLAALEGEVVEAEEYQSWLPNPAFTDIEKLLVEARLEANGLRDQHQQLFRVTTRDGEVNRERQEVYRKERELEQKLLESRTRLVELSSKQGSKSVQLAFLSGTAGNPFTITQEPVPPAKPTEPNPLLIIAFALVAGAALGLGTSVVAEFAKNSFRSPADLGRVMVVPILGVIGQIVTQAERRRRRVQQLAVGVSTAVILGVVIFVTWAWAVSPDLLTPGMKDGIEDFRSLFR